MVPHDYRVQKCMQRDGKVQYQNPAQSIQKSYVCSLAYSVDKYYRLQRGMNWFPDEQPSDEIKQQTENQLSAINWNVDIVLTHTCPQKYVPIEAFCQDWISPWLITVLKNGWIKSRTGWITRIGSVVTGTSINESTKCILWCEVSRRYEASHPIAT